MADVTTRGVVDYLQIGDDYGVVSIDEETGGSEKLILWYSDESAGPAGMYVMQLSLALSHGLTVELRHKDEWSAFIKSVKVLRAAT